MANGQNEPEMVLQQVPMQPSMHLAIKRFAKSRGQTLFEIYEEIITWFLDVKDNSGIEYLAYTGSRDSKYHSLWFDRKVLNRLKECSAAEKVSVTRIIFTAVVYFIRDRQIEWSETPTSE